MSPDPVSRRSARRCVHVGVAAALLVGVGAGTATAATTTLGFDAGPDVTVPEGSLFSRTVAIVDGSDDGEPGWSYTVEYGDGSATVGTTQTPTVELQYTYPDGPNAFVATVTVTDTPAEFATDTFAVVVENVVPTVTVTAAATTSEGATFTMVVDATDPGDPRAELSFHVDWQDGGFGTPVDHPLGSIQHVFTDDEDGPVNATTRNVRVTVFDDAGIALVVVPVVVNDVAPTIALGGAATVPARTPYTLDLGAITDPARFDTVISRTVNWGDGSVDVVATSGSFTHTYATRGTRTITVDLVDEDGTHLAAGSRTVVVVPVAPSAPTGLTATTLSKSAVQLAWTNTTTDQSKVYVERCRGNGCTSYVRIATLPGTATAYRNTGLPSRTTYTYRVRARNDVGFSIYSDTATATTRR